MDRDNKFEKKLKYVLDYLNSPSEEKCSFEEMIADPNLCRDRVEYVYELIKRKLDIEKQEMQKMLGIL